MADEEEESKEGIDEDRWEVESKEEIDEDRWEVEVEGEEIEDEGEGIEWKLGVVEREQEENGTVNREEIGQRTLVSRTCVPSKGKQR